MVVLHNVHVEEPVDVYDLKGSLYNRTCKVEARGQGLSVIRKDRDFLQDGMKLSVTEEDMQSLSRQIRCDTNFLRLSNSNNYSLLVGVLPHSSQALPATCRRYVSRDGRSVYQVGIIDILTAYNLKKKMENGIKSIFQGSEVSCVPPDQYADRFCTFMLTQVLQ